MNTSLKTAFLIQTVPCSSGSGPNTHRVSGSPHIHLLSVSPRRFPSLGEHSRIARARLNSAVASDNGVHVHVGSRITFSVLSKSSLLLATVFGRDAIEHSVDKLSITTRYQLRLMASLQARALQERDEFVMITRRDGDVVTGVLTVSRGLSASGAINYRDAEIFRDARVFSLCNMAVREEYRRRGIATSMLRSAEAHVLQTHGSDERDTIIMALSCEKYNEDAQRLYEALGYRLDDAWEDPRWLESVERGAVDVSRRVLLWKQLTA